MVLQHRYLIIYIYVDGAVGFLKTFTHWNLNSDFWISSSGSPDLLRGPFFFSFFFIRGHLYSLAPQSDVTWLPGPIMRSEHWMFARAGQAYTCTHAVRNLHDYTGCEWAEPKAV